MKNINITVNGPIGSGKTTLINALSKSLQTDGHKVLVQAEPSVIIPFVNDALEHFYQNEKNWAYPMQLLISAAQESYMQTLKEEDYDYAIMDAALSSSIYGYSHWKAKRITQQEFSTLESINRNFFFDFLFWLDPGLDTVKDNVKNRNQKILNHNSHQNQNDLNIDLSYLNQHYADFLEYKPIYLNKFKLVNEDINIFEINQIPQFKENNKTDYSEFIENWKKKIYQLEEELLLPF